MHHHIAKITLFAGLATTILFSGMPAHAIDGQKIFRGECGFCHSDNPNEAGDMDGPDLFGVVGRKAASDPDFKYSGGIRRAAKRNDLHWTPEMLDRFIADPATFIPKTRMGYPGLDIAEERKAVIEYLKTLNRQ